jgi:8-oxo-dGTP diphosphatase/8-oxo-dGTP diphosphatase/2-hydroxy-dATP diphosphatase
MEKTGTLIYVFKDNRILLGSKKYGKAKGKLNGYGGKIEITDGSVEKAALRELKEETGLEVKRIEVHAVLNMSWGEDQGARIFVFRAYELKNNPKESNEMTVKWFDIDSVPKERMWESDRYWFDLVLQDRKFKADLVFDSMDSHLIKKMIVEFVENIEI